MMETSSWHSAVEGMSLGFCLDINNGLIAKDIVLCVYSNRTQAKN